MKNSFLLPETLKIIKLFDIELVTVSIHTIILTIINDCKVHNNKLVVTPNIDHYVRIQKNDELKQIYKRSDYCLNDSRVFGLFAKIFLNTQIETITGSDITALLFQSELISDKKILIIGSTPKGVKTLIEKYNLENSHIFHYQPKMNFIADENEINSITAYTNSITPNIVFLALGSPQQEVLGNYLKTHSRFGVALCIGASIDYLSGQEIRAPKIIQSLYLEWLFRFAQSPFKRFRRYFIDCPKIIFYLWIERKNH